MKQVVVTAHVGGFFWETIDGKFVYHKRPWIPVNSLVTLEEEVPLSEEDLNTNPELVKKFKVSEASGLRLPINKSGELQHKEVKFLFVGKREVVPMEMMCEDSPHFHMEEYGMISGCKVTIDWNPSKEMISSLENIEQKT